MKYVVQKKMNNYLSYPQVSVWMKLSRIHSYMQKGGPYTVAMENEQKVFGRVPD